MINPALIGKFLKLMEAVNSAQKLYKSRTTPENQAKLNAALKEATDFFRLRGPELAGVIQAWMGKTALERAEAVAQSPDASTEALAQLLEQLANRARAGGATLTELEAATFDAVAIRLRNQAQEIERLQNDTFTAQARDTLDKVRGSEAGQKAIRVFGQVKDRIKSASTKVD